MTMRAGLRLAHRYLAFACAVLWLSQAATGLLMVFRWELDDAILDAPAMPLDLGALGARVAAVDAGPPARSVYLVYATGGVPGRFDLYTRDAAGREDVIRVDGAGNVLRTRPDGRDFAHVGLVPFAATLHQTLFAGDVGKAIIGLSGLLLLTTIFMGATLAWPRARQVRAVLWPKGARPGAARRYAWHRALGLWLALPAVLLVTTGALMTIDDSLERWLGQDATPASLLAAPALTGRPIDPAQAIATAMQRYPGAGLSGTRFPSANEPWYRVRLLQPKEWRRAYGMTTVYVSAVDGRVLLVEDALDAPVARAFLSNLYPIHTGEALGLAGRLVSLAVAAWLLTMLVLGLGLWWIRRPLAS